MRATLWAASIIAAAVGLTATAARAADLNDDYSVYERGDRPDDDHRYSDIYSQPKIAKRHDRDEDDDDYERKRRHYRDRQHHRRPRHYRRRRHAEYKRNHCAHKSAIKHRLRYLGWRDFRLVEARRNVAVIRARLKESNDRYRLSLDRCSGKILHADLLHGRRYESYAYRNRRHRRTY